MAQGVFNEVCEGLLQAASIRFDHRFIGWLDRELAASLRGRGSEALAQILKETGHRDRFDRECQTPLVSASDYKQILGQRRELIHLLDRRGGGFTQLLSARPVSQREFELGLVCGERSPQLVAGVVHESTLTLDCVL